MLCNATVHAKDNHSTGLAKYFFAPSKQPPTYGSHYKLYMSRPLKHMLNEDLRKTFKYLHTKYKCVMTLLRDIICTSQ